MLSSLPKPAARSLWPSNFYTSARPILWFLLALSACGPRKESKYDAYGIPRKLSGAFGVVHIQPDGGFMISHCAFDIKKTLCLLDSGADQSRVYDSPEFEKYKSEGDYRSGSIAGFSIFTEPLIAIKKLNVAHINLGTHTAARASILSYPQDYRSHGIEGVIGADVLLSDVFHLDFLKRRFSVGDGQIPTPTEFDLKKTDTGHVLLPAQLSGETIEGIFDTGASFTVVNRDYVKAHPDLFKRLKRIRGKDANGQDFGLTVFRAHDLELGHLSLPRLFVVATDFTQINQGLTAPIDFIFGFNVISKANWTIDRENGKWENEALPVQTQKFH